MPGLVVMPTVLANTLFSFINDGSYTVQSPDSLSVISPMYNEEKGAGQALTSLLEQDHMPEQIALSVNGCTDATYDVVSDTLKENGFVFEGTKALKHFNAILETWTSAAVNTKVNIIIYYRKVSKSESINNLLEAGIVNADRILIVDGDTIFHPGFVRNLRENFYRLKRVKRGKQKEFVLESYGLQSGSVTSLTPPKSSMSQRFISMGRKAEYAFSSVLREGQAKQFGKSSLFSNSRLYTVIGCGFVVRRDLFPMPTDTETEDHDFSLKCQNAETSYSLVTKEQLADEGFRFILGGKTYTPDELFGSGDKIVLKQGGNARFVDEAIMGTEDPPHFNGFIRQIERWNGGGQQNALKRFRKPLTTNVHFTVWTALFESILGIILLGLLPLLLALNVGNPSLGLPPLALGAWLGLDICLTLFIVAYGFYKLRRAEGSGRIASFFRSFSNGLQTIVPFMILRWLNPLTYVASATRVVPNFLFAKRRRSVKEVQGVTWERAYVKNKTRTQTVFTWTVLGFAVSTFAVANLAPYLNPINQEAWRLVYDTPFIDMRDFDDPFVLALEKQPTTELQVIGARLSPNDSDKSLSAYCDPSFTRLSGSRQSLKESPESYEPLSRWGIMTLARLAPLIAHLESAATAYDVPIELYLMVLLNESYLDPLAVGPTDDKGLSQVTSDALTLLKGLSSNADSAFYNPRLIPADFNVYDPDFSICAGAAKLSWALRQPTVDSEGEAYALYINPIYGLTNGDISEQHQPLVNAMMTQRPMAESLAKVFAAYEDDPDLLSNVERELIDVAYRTKDGELSLENAYLKTYELVQKYSINDESMYEKLLSNYFGSVDDAVMADTR